MNHDATGRALLVRLLTLALLPVLAPPVLAQPAPLGPEVAIDTEPGLYLEAPRLAGRLDGGFGLAWSRYAPDSPSQTIVVATAAADGSVSTVTEAVIGDDSMGLTDFVTVPDGYRALWERPASGRGGARVAADFELDGAPRGSPRKLAPVTTKQWSPRPRGGYVTWWAGDHGLSIQLVGEDGTSSGAAVRLAAALVLGATILHQSDASFLVVYSQLAVRHGRVEYEGLRAHRFDATGRPVGRGFRMLPAPGHGIVPFSRVALGLDGTLAVASSVSDVLGSHGVTLRTFTSSGVALGPPVAITTAAEDAQAESYAEAVAVDPEGSALVVWGTAADLYSPEARARVFSRTGEPLGPAFVLRTSASDGHVAVVDASAGWAGGAWLIAWVGASVPIDDEDTTMQVYLRRFTRE